MTDNHWTPSPESQEITEIDEQEIKAMMNEDPTIDPASWKYKDFTLKFDFDYDFIPKTFRWRIMGWSYFPRWDWWRNEMFKFRFKLFFVVNIGQDLIENAEEIELKEWLWRRMIRRMKERIENFWANMAEQLQTATDQYLIEKYQDGFFARELWFSGTFISSHKKWARSKFY